MRLLAVKELIQPLTRAYSRQVHKNLTALHMVVSETKELRISLATFKDLFSTGTQGSYGSAYEGVGGQRINLNFYESQFSASTYSQQRQTLQHQVGPSFAQDSSLQMVSYGRPSIIRNFLGRSIGISSRDCCDET